MFKKRIDIYKKRDREGWLQMRAALKEAGLGGVKSGHFQQDTVMAVHQVVGEALEILKKNGLVPQVDQDILVDASLRKKPVKDVF